MAVFGTLSNGSDAQLLATPRGMTLSSAVRTSLSDFFFAAWKGATLTQRPYVAFFELEPGGFWGLCQVTHLGRTNVGDRMAVWTALLSRQTLDDLDWASHLLIGQVFPDSILLPEPETRMALATVRPMATIPIHVIQYSRAFMPVLRESDNFSKPTHLIVRPPDENGVTGLTAEGALVGVWDRLGKLRRQPRPLSWCTWAGLPARGFQPARGFDLVLSNESDAIRTTDKWTTLEIGRTREGEARDRTHGTWWFRQASRSGVGIDDALGQLIVDAAEGNLDPEFVDILRTNGEAFHRLQGWPEAWSSPAVLNIFLEILARDLEVIPKEHHPNDIDEFFQSVHTRAAKALRASQDAPIADLALKKSVFLKLPNETQRALLPLIFLLDEAAKERRRTVMAELEVIDPTVVDWEPWLTQVEAALNDASTSHAAHLGRVTIRRAFGKKADQRHAVRALGQFSKAYGFRQAMELIKEELLHQGQHMERLQPNLLDKLFHAVFELRPAKIESVGDLLARFEIQTLGRSVQQSLGAVGKWRGDG